MCFWVLQGLGVTLLQVMLFPCHKMGFVFNSPVKTIDIIFYKTMVENNAKINFGFVVKKINNYFYYSVVIFVGFPKAVFSLVLLLSCKRKPNRCFPLRILLFSPILSAI